LSRPDDGAAVGDGIVASLSVAPAGGDVFEGASPSDSPPRVFGGQVVAQSMAAAEGSVEAGRIHSIHAGFLAPGDPTQPIRYEVARLRDGRSYLRRHVVARQGGDAIFQASVSFHRGDEPDPLEHHDALLASIPPPDQLPSLADLFRRWTDDGPELSHARLVDLRPSAFVDPADPSVLPPDRACWFRTSQPLPEEPTVHARALAFASDIFLVATALLPHGLPSSSPDIVFVATLDHTVWFHHPARADEWLLHVMHSPVAAGGRGLARGSIYDAGGRLVASTAQEGVLRRPSRRAGGSRVAG
jgi:acyl-CoA thioesterase-2